MSKVAALTSLSPLAFAANVEVLEAEARAVLEQLNWAAGERPVVHFALGCGPAGYSSGAQALLNLLFPTASGYAERLHVPIILADDAVATVVGVRCYVSGSDQCLVRVTVGAAVPVVLTTFTAATNDDMHTATIYTNNSGTGEIAVTIEGNHSSGSADDCFIRMVRCQTTRIDALSLFDPQDE